MKEQGEQTSRGMTGKKAVLFTVTTTAFLIPFMGSSVNVALPHIAADLDMDAVLLSWVAAAYLLSAAVFLVPVGRIADIHGRKKVYVYGIVVFTTFSFLSGIASSPAALIAFRFAQGIGSAMVFGTGTALLTAVFPRGYLGRALGITVAAVYIGLSAGPLLGGLLTEHIGWRSIFLAVVPLGMSAFVLAVLRLDHDEVEAKGESFDLGGSVVYSMALMFLILGFSRLPEMLGLWLVAAGFAGTGFFLWWESRQRNPVLDIDMIRSNRVFALSNLAALISYSATFAVVFMMSLYLQYIKGLTPQNAGFILVCQPVVMALFSPFAGKLSDRIEPRIVASAGMAMTTVGLIMLAFLDGNSSLGFVVMGLAVLGMGIAFFSSPNTNAVMSSVDSRHYGFAAGMVGTMRLVGQVMSMAMAMMALSVFIGRSRITPEHYSGFVDAMTVAFFVFAVLCFVGMFASLARGKLR